MIAMDFLRQTAVVAALQAARFLAGQISLFLGLVQ
jgi:hypothetical protein